MRKAEFWKKHAGADLNARQKLMLNKLLNGLEDKLTSSKWAKITKASQPTADRYIRPTPSSSAFSAGTPQAVEAHPAGWRRNRAPAPS